MRNGGVFLSCCQQRLSAPTKLPESLCEKKGDGARYWRLMSQRSNRWECRKRDKPQKAVARHSRRLSCVHKNVDRRWDVGTPLGRYISRCATETISHSRLWGGEPPQVESR